MLIITTRYTRRHKTNQRVHPSARGRAHDDVDNRLDCGPFRQQRDCRRADVSTLVIRLTSRAPDDGVPFPPRLNAKTTRTRYHHATEPKGRPPDGLSDRRT